MFISGQLSQSLTLVNHNQCQAHVLKPICLFDFILFVFPLTIHALTQEHHENFGEGK